MALLAPRESVATTENVKAVTSVKKTLNMYSPSCEPFIVLISGNIPELLIMLTLKVSPRSVTFTK